MKIHSLLTALFATAVFSPILLFAQDPAYSTQITQTNPSNPAQQRPGDATSMQDSGPNSGDVGQIMKDKMFLRKAAAGGLTEVQLGQLAVQKAGSDDVKAFGQKMVDDHTKLNSELAPIADSMGVRLPKSMNKEDQAEYDKLNGLSGNDFDTEYLSFMIRDHHKALRQFRNEAASTSDPTLRDAVTKGEEVIHEHMVIVVKLAHDKGVPMPPRRSNQPTPAPAP
jgi:putative membrane protein